MGKIATSWYIVLVLSMTSAYGDPPPEYDLQPNWVEGQAEGYAFEYTSKKWKCRKIYWHEQYAQWNNYDNYYYYGQEHYTNHKLCDWRWNGSDSTRQYEGMPYAYCQKQRWVDFNASLSTRPYDMPGGHLCHYDKYEEDTGNKCPPWICGVDCSGLVSRCLWTSRLKNTEQIMDALEDWNAFYDQISEVGVSDVLVSDSVKHCMLTKGADEDSVTIYEASSDNYEQYFNKCKYRRYSIDYLEQNYYRAGSFYWDHVHE